MQTFKEFLEEEIVTIDEANEEYEEVFVPAGMFYNYMKMMSRQGYFMGAPEETTYQGKAVKKFVYSNPDWKKKRIVYTDFKGPGK